MGKMKNQEVTTDIREKSFWQKQADLWIGDGKTGVARKEIEKFTCGTRKPKSMANLDCQGLGPDSIRHGREIIYPFETLVPWLEERTETVRKRLNRPRCAEEAEELTI